MILLKKDLLIQWSTSLLLSQTTAMMKIVKNTLASVGPLSTEPSWRVATFHRTSWTTLTTKRWLRGAGKLPQKIWTIMKTTNGSYYRETIPGSLLSTLLTTSPGTARSTTMTTVQLPITILSYRAMSARDATVSFNTSSQRPASLTLHSGIIGTISSV